MEGYNLESDLRQDRLDTQGGIGGGLLVYTRFGIKIRPLNIVNSFNQFCSFAVKCQGTTEFNITLVYRSSNSCSENNEHLVELIEGHSDNMLIIGYFNYPKVNWSDDTCGNKCGRLLEAIHERNLHQAITFPTHQRGGLLDLALIDRQDIAYSIEDLGFLGTSDHTTILLELDVGHCFNTTAEKIPDWAKADLVALTNYFKEVRWSDKLSDLTTESSWDTFVATVKEGIDRYVPLKPRRINHKPLG